ncbi:DUF1295-domain-containing protein [Basidiobolus meristosporus CBS 931.73]|uniref:DUF1295-domain-containing protein n=1 Tax=Basidiobolus meristosporus CBS 931.73 TaxID=1314790 RepID=A0A1Y1YWB2_9FUNG|nr:DUF1295-domain-containing protein [Basidiobolus meristosporus CBS 931.73]|eukprot:ORY02249.1 DUF1295-domain-containing protein [Basidiobolus meristosporus CBS 931.73]
MDYTTWNATYSFLESIWFQVGNNGWGLDNLHPNIVALSASDPFVYALVICGFATFVTWLLSVISGNYSQVDKLWSILPVYYLWVWCFGLGDIQEMLQITRVRLVLYLTTIWGARLTYNFHRKGGYTWAGEDYRWPVIRSFLHPVLFQILNVVFIAIWQNLLLLALVFPGYVVLRVGNKVAYNWLDTAAAGICLASILLEIVADQQQWNFQERKHHLIRTNAVLEDDYKRGFLSSGLFGISRHPNYVGEMAFWWGIYLFGISSMEGATWFHWTGIGTLSLTALFQASTLVTEMLTQKKYPLYKIYKKAVPRFIPFTIPAKPEFKKAE